MYSGIHSAWNYLLDSPFNLLFRLSSAVSGTLVLSCVILTGIRKFLSTLPEDNKQRQRFRFHLI